MFGRKPQPKPLPPAGFHEQLPVPPVTIDHEPPLSRAQLQTIDWTAPEERQLPAKRPVTYVPSASELLRPPTVTIASPDAHVDANILPASTVEARVLGTHKDRASAWLRYSLPLSIVASLVVTIAAKTLYGFPLLSWLTFITLGLGFMVCYGLLLFRYWETSPEGVALLHTKRLWGFLYSEQAYRHRIEGAEWEWRQQMMAEKHEDDRRARRG